MAPRRPASSIVVSLLATAVLIAGCGRSTAADPSAQPVRPSAVPSSSAPSSSAPSSSAPVRRPTAPVDELVPVGGARLHVRCAGTGDVTVVLIAGFGDAGESWARVAPAVERRARVCTYARFGLGTSDAPPTTQTFTTQAQDLRTALRALDEPGPYVVVGHSFGGAEAVTFTQQHAADVTGLLLLDASPTDWQRTTCTVTDNGTAGSQGFLDICAMTSSPANNPERLDGPAAFAEVAAITSLGTVPMVVVTADQHPHPGLAAGEEDHLDQVWRAGQQHWLGLSPSARLVSVDHTSHLIQVDRPDVVIDQIDRLLP